MAYFEIRERSGAGRFLGTIEASSVESAARKHRPDAERVTGDRGLSGCFQVYGWSTKCNASTSSGDQFHVHEL